MHSGFGTLVVFAVFSGVGTAPVAGQMPVVGKTPERIQEGTLCCWTCRFFCAKMVCDMMVMPYVRHSGQNRFVDGVSSAPLLRYSSCKYVSNVEVLGTWDHGMPDIFFIERDCRAGGGVRGACGTPRITLRKLYLCKDWRAEDSIGSAPKVLVVAWSCAETPLGGFVCVHQWCALTRRVLPHCGTTA